MSVSRPAAAKPRFASHPFSLGVASGDPVPDGFVLWTRLAPDPVAEDGSGGMPPERVDVRYEVAEDELFTRVVRRSRAEAGPDFAHSVHVEVGGLRSAREYFYRFRVGREISPVGRTKTAPAFGAHVERVRLAIASCQNFTDGHYPAFRDMTLQDFDLLVHLGDYIYEGASQGDPALGRGHLPARECITLADYRVRYGQYKTDPNLQAAHALFPWLTTPDDHEVDNDWAGGQDGHDVREGFLERRAAAFRASYENLPLRRAQQPAGPNMQIFRRLRYGDIAQFHLLDTRQFRDNQAECTNDQRVDGYCPGSLDPDRTILGDEQERWLYDGLASSPARWNVLCNQTHFAPFDHLEGPGRRFSTEDAWGEGYVGDREQLLDFIAARRPSNPVIVTGDSHKNWLFDLKEDFDNPDSETLATEYLGTSISSGGDIQTTETRFGGTPDNPHEVFANGQRGYLLVDVSPERWWADFRVSDTVQAPEAPLHTVASFVTEDGRPGGQRV
ncbi:MAG: alkaline phosphatase D family protein [Streptomycetales bacterium]